MPRVKPSKFPIDVEFGGKWKGRFKPEENTINEEELALLEAALYVAGRP